MPQRFLRPGITTSSGWNSVSFAAQSLFVRLLTLVDDFGRYDARPMLLRSHAFPLSPEITSGDVEAFCDELTEAGLIRVYTVDDKDYLQVEKWQERARCASKYPAPPGDDSKSQPRGMIYFIEAEKSKRVKIGFTNWKVGERLSKLQTGSPEKLSLLGFMQGTPEQERALHKRFNPSRLEGEWFAPTAELKALAGSCEQMLSDEFICLPPSPSPSPSPSPLHPRGRSPERLAIWKSNEAQRIAAIFHRGSETKWSEKEVEAFKKLLPIDSDHLELIEARYAAEWPPRSQVNTLRHDLFTFLNNFSGEVDRARSWRAKARNGKPPEISPITGQPYRQV